MLVLVWALGCVLGCNDSGPSAAELEARYASVAADAQALGGAVTPSAIPELTEIGSSAGETNKPEAKGALDQALGRGRGALDEAHRLRAAHGTSREVFAWLTAARGWLAAAEALVARQATAISAAEAAAENGGPGTQDDAVDAKQSEGASLAGIRALRRERLTELVREQRELARGQARREERQSLYALTIPGQDGLLDARLLPKGAARRAPYSVDALKHVAIASHRMLARHREQEARYFIEATQRLAPDAALPTGWERRIVQGNAGLDEHLAEVDALAREAFAALHRARQDRAEQRGRIASGELKALVARLEQLGFPAEVGPRGLMIAVPRAARRAPPKGRSAADSPQATRLRTLAKVLAPMPGPVAIEFCAPGPRAARDPSVAPLLAYLQAGGIARDRLWPLQRRCVAARHIGPERPEDAEELAEESDLGNDTAPQGKAFGQPAAPANDSTRSVYLILPALGPAFDAQPKRFGEVK